jgi:hypothetical protein
MQAHGGRRPGCRKRESRTLSDRLLGTGRFAATEKGSLLMLRFASVSLTLADAKIGRTGGPPWGFDASDDLRILRAHRSLALCDRGRRSGKVGRAA